MCVVVIEDVRRLNARSETVAFGLKTLILPHVSYLNKCLIDYAMSLSLSHLKKKKTIYPLLCVVVIRVQLLPLVLIPVIHHLTYETVLEL